MDFSEMFAINFMTIRHKYGASSLCATASREECETMAGVEATLAAKRQKNCAKSDIKKDKVSIQNLTEFEGLKKNSSTNKA